MIGWLLLAGACLGLLAAGVAIVVRRLRSARLVSPILLDEALDPDLFDLCRRLRRAAWLTPDRRRQLAGELVMIAAHRLEGHPNEDEVPRLDAVRRALRRTTDGRRRAGTAEGRGQAGTAD